MLSDEAVQHFNSKILEDDDPKWSSNTAVLAPIYGEDGAQQPRDGDYLIIQRDERLAPVEVGATITTARWKAFLERFSIVHEEFRLLLECR